MFKLFAFCTFMMSSAFALEIFPGGHDGGGGNGIVCYRDESFKEIVSVELLDFYEGRNLEGLIIPSYEGSYLEIYKKVIQKSASKRILAWIDNGDVFANGFRFLPSGVRLKTIDDSSEIFIPKDCRVEQIANFQGMSRIFIVSDFWNYLSETDRAGLLMHEYLWSSERIAGAKQSSRARRNVARYFADNFKFSKIKFNPVKDDFICTSNNISNTMNTSSDGTLFLVSKIDGTNDCSLEFKTISGLPVFSLTTGILSDCHRYNLLPNVVPTTTTGDFTIYEGFDELIPLFSDNVRTHAFSWKLDYDISVPVKKMMSVKVSNLEFMGFDDLQAPLTCDQIDELDLKEPWWL